MTGVSGKSGELSASELEKLKEEMSVLSTVSRALREEIISKGHLGAAVSEEIKNLLREARHASEMDLPHLLQQIHTQSAVQVRGKPQSLPELDSPYFAHMVLREDGKIRHVLLGYSSYVDTKCPYPIIDWRNAPLAQIFFRCREGDPFEQELPGRVARGVVEARRILTIRNGILHD